MHDLFTPDGPDSVILAHERSFEGFLTAVFVAYERKLADRAQFCCQDTLKPQLFTPIIPIDTAPDKAQRVLDKLGQRLGRQGVRLFMWAYLSEIGDIGTTLFGVLRYALAQPQAKVLKDYSHPDVLRLHQTVKSVGREKHRMEAFVRFEKMADGVYFARIAPDFNVLPLIAPHFKNRYQDQSFAIYDTLRHYGLYHVAGCDYQLIVDVDTDVLSNPSKAWSDEELRYQQFWQGYFYHVNIRERANACLHRQQLPQRYWRYLSEKQVRGDEDFLKKWR